MPITGNRGKLLVYDGSNKASFPFGHLILLLMLYVIGLFTLELRKLSQLDWQKISGKNILREDIRANWTLSPELTWQWQVFSFHLLHFAVVHFAYVGVLLLYYVPGLERATSKKFIFLAFYFGGVIGAIINGFLLFIIIAIYPNFNDWVLSQGEFMGSSIGVWALIGFSVPISYKRRFYWFGIILLLVIEFFLKIIKHGDITANVVHVLVFSTCLILGAKFITYGDSGGYVGELKINRKEDLFFIIGIAIHAIGLFIFFFEQLGYI